MRDSIAERVKKRRLGAVKREMNPFFQVTENNQQRSPILRLPPEVRNKIYVYVLGDRTFEMIQRKNSVESKTTTKNAHALLSVSRQIHSETVNLPYRLNIFSCSPCDFPTGRMFRFMEGTGLEYITEVHCELWIKVSFWLPGPRLVFGEFHSNRHFCGIEHMAQLRKVHLIMYGEPRLEPPNDSIEPKIELALRNGIRDRLELVKDKIEEQLKYRKPSVETSTEVRIFYSRCSIVHTF